MHSCGLIRWQPSSVSALLQAQQMPHVAVEPLDAHLQPVGEALQEAKAAEAHNPSQGRQDAQHQGCQAKLGVDGPEVRLVMQHLQT